MKTARLTVSRTMTTSVMPLKVPSPSMQFTTSESAARELLRGGREFLPPDQLLGGITDDEARAFFRGIRRSIAQTVAHMQYWNLWTLAEITRGALPYPEQQADTFQFQYDSWEQLRREFLESLDDLDHHAHRADEPSIADPDRTVGYLLMELALHNAYYYGQIALIRQMLGHWTPDGEG